MSISQKKHISPENTEFIQLSFEGPDGYSMAGGLGTRVTELTETLAQLGYSTHLFFIGDPEKPGIEEKYDGKLKLYRWCQWISKYYPNGVYDGEEAKLNDFNDSIPGYVQQHIIEPAINKGKFVVILADDWQTTEVMCWISDRLHIFNERKNVFMMWTLNSLMSLQRINWGRLGYVATIATVSKYMRSKMLELGVDPVVIPNGIPKRLLEPVNPGQMQMLQKTLQGATNKHILFKIGRFDPDKRWIIAIDVLAQLKSQGYPSVMVMRGGIEPHGYEVLTHAEDLGLTIKDIRARKPSVAECLDLFKPEDEADIYNLQFFVPEEFVRLCYAGSDVVLANSGHEPFGLVGLEVMAAGGIACTGSTGEDYASDINAIVIRSEDAAEITEKLLNLWKSSNEIHRKREEGKKTAREYTWESVIENKLIAAFESVRS